MYRPGTAMTRAAFGPSQPKIVPTAFFMILLAASCTRAFAWDYTSNGRDWDDLGLCAGKGIASAQSPINLPLNAPGITEKKIFFRYPHFGRAVEVYNNGYSIAFTLPQSYKGGFGYAATPGELQGTTAGVYRLWQVNFHAPSEHTLNGERTALEMQMVHQSIEEDSGKNRIAVVSVLFNEAPGSREPFLDFMEWWKLPTQPWDKVQINADSVPQTGATQNVSDHGLHSLLGGGVPFFTYEGSSTVPPCEPGVTYYVRKQPVPAETLQLEAFTNVLKGLCPPKGNYRSAPATSTAMFHVNLVKSLTIDSMAEAVTNSVHTGHVEESSFFNSSALASPALTRRQKAMIVDNPDFRVMQAEDSDELREQKVKYNSAQMTYDGANYEVKQAEVELEKAQEDYDNAMAPVLKMQIKWRVMAATDKLEAARHKRIVAYSNLERAIAEALHVVLREKTGAAKIPKPVSTTMAVPTEAGSGRVATTIAPDKSGFLWKQKTTTAPPPGSLQPRPEDHGLLYEPRVELPRGVVSNPFIEDHLAATEDAEPTLGAPPGTGGGVPARLAPSLKQPDLAQSTAPVAKVIVCPTCWGKEEAPVGPPMQLVIKLPLPVHNVENMTEMKVQLAEAMAESAHVPRERIVVREVRPAPYKNIASGSGPVPQAG